MPGTERTHVVVAGWFSFPDGEATAGDVGAAEAVGAALDRAGIAYRTAWSPAMRPGGPTLREAASPAPGHLVFTCGPLVGRQVRDLHRLFRASVRLAVGVSVPDPDDPAVLGFHRVLARDAPDGDAPPRPDLCARPVPRRAVPVVGVTPAPEQREYGPRRAHGAVHRALGTWLAGQDCAPVPLDTRLDPRDWRHCATTGQFDALVRRLDAVVTTRLHGLVLALRNGVPALAVDPVAGGAKVAAQGHALGWPVLTVDTPRRGPPHAELDRWWAWCLGEGSREARRAGARAADGALEELVRLVTAPPGAPDAR